MTFYFALITGAACFAAAGYWAGRWHERDLAERRRGGYITLGPGPYDQGGWDEERGAFIFGDALDRAHGGPR